MLKVIKGWALLIAILLPTALFAQDQPTSEEATTEGEATENSGEQIPGGLAIGVESTETQVGETYELRKIQSWNLRCVRAENGNDPCRLHQLLRDEQDTPVAEINFFTVPEGGKIAAGASVITPLETLLTEQIRLSVDAGKARFYPFRFCGQVGCVSRMGFTADELAQFKRGANAQIVIVPATAPNTEVVLKISLAGFTAGFEALSEPAAE